MALGLWPSEPNAKVFGVGEVDAVIDLTFSYGVLARTESRDLDFVGIANGGRAHSVDYDDGTLNYDTGLVSNEIRLNGDLTLVWRNFGFFIRGFGFYDFETELDDREHSQLSTEARRLVGAGGRLQEYYLSAGFTPWGLPVHIRVGDQIINWGEGTFLRFGTDVINPVDFVSVLQPNATARDIFVPQGMVWVASNITENLAIEGFYQYRWEEVIDPPIGWFFAANDLFGGDGVGFSVTGKGLFSDLGTDLDAAFPDVPDANGFDPFFMRVPSVGRREPRDQGQFGFTLQAWLSFLNAGNARIHFINYHSRLAVVSGITADQAAIEQAEAVSGGSSDEVTYWLGQLANETAYVVTYPEDIRMLGFSFNTATPITGTLVATELSHHFNWPVQVEMGSVIDDALSPITDALGLTSVGKYGADQLVPGVDRAHKTQLSFSIAQAFGPRLWSSRSILSFDIGWVHFDDLQPNELFDDDSWGYSLFAGLSYEGVLGAVNLEPFVGFTHDVSGTTPLPAGAFIEGRKSVSTGMGISWTSTVTAQLRYVGFFDGKPLNAGIDRDFVSFSIRYHY